MSLNSLILILKIVKRGRRPKKVFTSKLLASTADRSDNIVERFPSADRFTENTQKTSA